MQGGIFASADGIGGWKELPFRKLHARDDTAIVGNWDPSLQKYVIIVRRDVPACCNKSADVTRHIGRCQTKNISDWYAERTVDGNPCCLQCFENKKP